MFDYPADQGYLKLAAAIVRQAVRDYSCVLEGLLHEPDNVKKEHLLREKSLLEEFFYSQQFELYTDIDPTILIEKVTDRTIIRCREKAERRIRKLMEKKEKLQKGGVQP